MSRKLCCETKISDVEACCNHSYCEIQRRKQLCGCIDIPPKGLPWASGRLKYLPGQRDLYCNLYVSNLVGRELMKEICYPKNKCQKQKRPKPPCRAASIDERPSSRRCSRRSSRMSGRSSVQSDRSCQPVRGNDAFEIEEVMICDGATRCLRKGYILRPHSCKPDSPKESESKAAISEKQPDDENDSCKTDEEKGDDNDIICLCIPRCCLEEYEKADSDQDDFMKDCAPTDEDGQPGVEGRKEGEDIEDAEEKEVKEELETDETNKEE